MKTLGGILSEMSRLKRISSAGAFVIAIGLVTEAEASILLATPIVAIHQGGTSTLLCAVTNVGTKPATVSVSLIAPDGSTLAQAPNNVDGCPLAPATLGPGVTCTAAPQNFLTEYCAVTSSTSKLRAVMIVGDSTTLQITMEVPATR
jgi:hypothetical protein